MDEILAQYRERHPFVDIDLCEFLVGSCFKSLSKNNGVPTIDGVSKMLEKPGVYQRLKASYDSMICSEVVEQHIEPEIPVEQYTNPEPVPEFTDIEDTVSQTPIECSPISFSDVYNTWKKNLNSL